MEGLDIKKNEIMNEIMSFAAIWINLEITILNEVKRKTNEVRERQIHDIFYMLNLKKIYIQMNLFAKLK